MTVLSALFLYAVAICSHGLIHCSPVSKTQINGNFTPRCSYCTRIYGPNSPQCWICAGQLVPGSSPFPAGTGVTDSRVWCALCKKVLGEGSPRCNAVCHRKTPGIITSSFPHLQSPELPPFVTYNIECAFCQFILGYNSPMCYGVCTHRFQSIGETISDPVNPVKRKKVY